MKNDSRANARQSALPYDKVSRLLTIDMKNTTTAACVARVFGMWSIADGK